MSLRATQGLRRAALRFFAPLGLCLGVAALTACRADVDGVWDGTIGKKGTASAQYARLSLDQSGSIVDGQVCVEKDCSEIDDGSIDEDALTLEFGWPGCSQRPSLLDAYVEGGSITGVVQVDECACEDGTCESTKEVDLERAD